MTARALSAARAGDEDFLGREGLKEFTAGRDRQRFGRVVVDLDFHVSLGHEEPAGDQNRAHKQHHDHRKHHDAKPNLLGSRELGEKENLVNHINLPF